MSVVLCGAAEKEEAMIQRKSAGLMAMLAWASRVLSSSLRVLPEFCSREEHTFYEVRRLRPS